MVLGRLTAQEKGRDRIRMGAVLDMPVLECRADLSGRWGKRRAERALKRLARAGVEQVLLPDGFPWPELMERYGLTPPDAGPLIRAMAAPLALAALERLERPPERATVALLGRPGAGDAARAARQLCPLVRRLALAEGAAAEDLRRTWGTPVLPPDSPADAALCFAPGYGGDAPLVLRLWQGEEGLMGFALYCPALPPEQREDLPLLAALYQAGKLGRGGVKVLDKCGRKNL